jgi:regulator of protease activity HflC (stomatin/prohibitin superfamily)
MILESEGMRQAEILKAEGFKIGEILRAEGDAQARLTRADAEAKAVEMVATAAERFFHDRAALSKQLDVLQATLGQNVKFVIPGNADLVTVLGLDSQTSPLMVPLRKAQDGVHSRVHPGGPSTPAS